MPSKRSAAPRSPSTSPTFPSDWHEFLSLLISLQVKFVVVGAHAFAIHGRPRMTEALDVFIEATTTNATRLRQALVEFGFGAAAPDANVLAPAHQEQARRRATHGPARHRGPPRETSLSSTRARSSSLGPFSPSETFVVGARRAFDPQSLVAQREAAVVAGGEHQASRLGVFPLLERSDDLAGAGSELGREGSVSQSDEDGYGPLDRAELRQLAHRGESDLVLVAFDEA